jgi:hypothetical protein
MQVFLDKEMNISLSMSIKFLVNNKKIKYKYIKGIHYENENSI